MRVGTRAPEPPSSAAELFDLSLLQEVYSEDPSLITGPTLTPEAAASAAPA